MEMRPGSLTPRKYIFDRDKSVEIAALGDGGINLAAINQRHTDTLPSLERQPLDFFRSFLLDGYPDFVLALDFDEISRVVHLRLFHNCDSSSR